MSRIKLATAWLSGCSGCHMGILNLHGGLMELFQLCDLVYSPLADFKEYPAEVDIALIEGAISNRDNLEMARIIRRYTKKVVSLGDCAINGNVAALRNPGGKAAVLEAAYADPVNKPVVFGECVPPLFDKVLPLHQVIPVDAFIPGCPPEPEAIRVALHRVIERL
ncbi:MAG: oxidoreductase [Geobacter sp.]|nr:MAG: oxidoreductase [Geobacter sp.]